LVSRDDRHHEKTRHGMRVSDTLAGLLILCFGIAVAVYARTFPSIPGQNVGPGLFPTIIGAGFTLCGAVLAFAGARQGRAASIQTAEWVRRPRMVSNFLLVIVDLLFYLLAVDALGFLVTGVIFLSALLLAFNVARRWVVPIAIAVTFAIHYGFYTLLHVPLPWGVLEGIAW
jgi:putative tricarboxylic transport membrane protein